MTKKLAGNNLLFKNLIVMLVLFASLMVTVWAWFVVSDTSEVDGMSVSIEAGESLEISLQNNGEAVEDKTYTSYINLSSHPELMQDLYFLDITGDGLVFQRPTLTQVYNNPQIDTSGTWIEAEPGKQYLSFDIFLRSDKQVEVYLDAESELTPVCGYDNLTWNSEAGNVSGYNPSSYGYFSRDCIIGATRISFLNPDKNGVNMLWIPSPEIYLNTSATPFTVRTDVTQADGLGTYEHVYYDINKTMVTYENAVTSLSATMKNKPSTSQTRIAMLTEQGSDGMYYSKTTVNLWIEGCDTEARRALSGGKFDLGVKFVAYEIE